MDGLMLDALTIVNVVDQAVLWKSLDRRLAFKQDGANFRSSSGAERASASE